MENNNSSNEGQNNQKKIFLLQKKISHLRFFVYTLVASLILLATIIVLWANSVYFDSQFETYYSVAPRELKGYLYLSPKEGHYQVGDEFTIDVIINTGGKNVNAVAAYLSYAKDKMEAISIDISGSVFDIKFEELINPLEGKIKIGLATPTPGINVYNGKVATVKFKAKEKTLGLFENIYFDFTKDSDLFSGIFLDDMKGTNILEKTRGARIIIN